MRLRPCVNDNEDRSGEAAPARSRLPPYSLQRSSCSRSRSWRDIRHRSCSCCYLLNALEDVAPPSAGDDEAVALDQRVDLVDVHAERIAAHRTAIAVDDAEQLIEPDAVDASARNHVEDARLHWRQMHAEPDAARPLLTTMRTALHDTLNPT